jgi:hypothetical protein
MTAQQRPIAITLIAALYFALGILGFAHNFSGFLALQRDAIYAEITEVIAFIAGAGLYFAQNWARWLALAWIAFHVYLASLNSTREMALHAFFLVAIGWILFRPESRTFFRQNRRGNAKEAAL